MSRGPGVEGREGGEAGGFVHEVEILDHEILRLRTVRL